LTPVVAVLIAAASAEDKNTCKNGIALHRFTDSKCKKALPEESQRKEVITQK